MSKNLGPVAAKGAIFLSLLFAFSFNNLAVTEYSFLIGSAPFYFILVALLVSFADLRLHLRKSDLAFISLLLIVCASSSLIGCVDPAIGLCKSRSFTGLVGIVYLWLVVVIVANITFRDASALKLFFRGLIGSVVVAELLSIPDIWALAQGRSDSIWEMPFFSAVRYSPDGVFDAPRFRGFTQEPSYFGVYLATAYPFLLHWLTTNNKRWFKLLILVGAWVLLFTSLSKAGIVVCAITTLLFGMRYPKKILLPLAITVPLMTWVVLPSFDNVLSANEAYLDQWAQYWVDYSTITRFGHMFAGLGLWLEHPFWGVGLGVSGYLLPDFYPDWVSLSPEIEHWSYRAPDGGVPTFAFLVKILAELGLIGFIVVVIPISAVLLRGMYYWFRSNEAARGDQVRNTDMRLLGVYVVSFVAFLIASFGLEGPYFQPAWVIFGALLGQVRREMSGRKSGIDQQISLNRVV